MNQERMMSVEEDTNSAIMHPSNHHKTIQFKLDDDIVAPPEKQSKKSVRKHRHIQIQDPPKQQLQESLPSKPARLDLDTNYYNNSRNEMTISPGEPSGDDNDEDDDERGERRTHLVGRAWDRLNRKRQWLMRRLSSGWMSGSPSTGGSVSSGSDVSVSTLHLFRYASSRERTAVIIGIMLMWYAASWQPISVFILATMAALMGHYTKHTSWALEHLNASEELSHVNWMAMPSFVDNSNIEPTTTAPLDQILPAPTSSTTAPSMELQNLEETGQQTPLPVHVPASDYDSFNLMGPLQTFLSSLFGFDLEAQHGITVDEILARESREFLRESFEINGAAFLLALTQLLAFFIGTTLITWAARRQASHVKLLYYRSCLSQEMSWFEGVDSAGGGSGSSLNALVDKYEDGIGMKLSLLCYFLGHVALFTLTAFYHLAEMAMFCMPFVLAVWLVVIYLSEWQAVAIGQQAVFAKRSLQLAEEILAAIRTVFAFNGQQKELARYSLSLSPFYRKSIIRHLYTALNTSLSKFSIFACFAAYCFYAMRLFPPYAAQAPSNKAAVLAVLRGAEVSIVNILISIPFMEALQQARGSIARIYSAIERRSRIDPDAEGAGLRPADWEPSISFRAVQFSYTDRAYLTKHRATLPIISLMGSPWLDNNPNGPQHPQQQRRRPPFGTRKKPRRLDAKKLAAIGSTYTPCKRVLNHFSLDVKAGQSIALVGPSGSGKSTLLALVQRLYDVGSGRILVGKHDIRDLSVAWLRNQIAVVSQEPSLFDMSIEDNIRLGMSSDDEAAAAGEDDIGQQVIEAAQAAGAHDFITRLPEGYATRVGSAGVQLSGGQKQRIAIARALIRKPKILLLDEPTSALDTESEAQVQVALRAASVGRTTLTVAHRLSTVQHADLIVVVNEGQVVECGKHDKLMAKPKSLYRQLYAEQQQAAAGSGGRTNDAAKTEWTWPEGDDTSSCSSSTSSSCGFSVNSDKQAEMSSDDSASQVSSSSTAQTNRLELDENARDTCSELVSDSDDSMVIDDTCETKPAGGDDKQQAPAPGFMQLWRFCEVPVASSLAVVFVCLLAGLILPLHLIAHSYLFAAFAYGEPDEIGYQLRSFGLLILSCSSLVFVISFLQVVLPGYVGEQISLRLRAKTLEALLRKPMFYFDMKANSAGSLCDRFNTHICALQSIAGTRTATMLEALATLTIGAIYGFGQNLRLSMFCLGFALLVLLTTIVESRIVQLESSLQQKFDAQLAHLMADSLSNIRTIASLNKETFFTDKFAQIIRQREVGVGRALLWFRTFLTSLKFVMPAMSWSASMYYGCHLLVAGSIDLRTIFIICPVVLFAVNDTFRALVFLPELLKVRKSLESLHSMNTEFDITPTGQPLKRNKTTEQLARFESNANSNNKWQQQPQPTARASGRIEFCSVHFAYPSRPSARVLRGLSLSIRPGESVALVGASGSGKSSSVNLLEKLYEYQAGEVKLDGRELRELDTDWVRSQIGLVSQEPVLLSYTIGDNIRYGDNSRVVSLSEVIDAAKRANIHEFIMSLPKRYDTQLHGSNHASGCQLSGGQRQRLAIARALIRRAPILVFDEATSALDARNEVQVQEALDRAREGRTNLTIAHRLACVRNADKIAVLSEGRVVELGRHDELMQLARGHYRALWQRQHQDQDLDAAGVGSRESASGEAEVAIAGHLADDRV